MSGTPFASRAAGCLRFLGAVGVVLAVIVAGEVLRIPFAPLGTFLAPYRVPLHRALLGVTIAGGLLFVGGFVTMLVRSGQPMSPEKVDELMRGGPVGRRLQWYHFRGKRTGREVHMGATFAEVKQLLRTGAWWRDPGWRPFFALFAGALLLVAGGFGLAVLHGPPAVKLLCGVALLYAGVRLVWGFWRA